MDGSLLGFRHFTCSLSADLNLERDARGKIMLLIAYAENACALPTRSFSKCLYSTRLLQRRKIIDVSRYSERKITLHTLVRCAMWWPVVLFSDM